MEFVVQFVVIGCSSKTQSTVVQKNATFNYSTSKTTSVSMLNGYLYK